MKTIKKLLKDDGVLVVRSVDDGSKIFFHDDEIIRTIIDVHHKSPSVSDIMNGRKLFYQLKMADYNNILMEYQISDTVNLTYEERMQLYDKAEALECKGII